MPNESPGTGSSSSEVTMRRTREPGVVGSEPRARRLARWLEDSRWFRPTALILLSVGAGLLVAPELASRNFPTDQALLGTPASENIKAPFDIDVVDDDATSRLREEAAAQTRRVYDFDTVLAERIGRRAEEAFAAVRAQGARLVEENGGRTPPRAALTAVTNAARGAFEQTLGSRVSDAQFEMLTDLGFGAGLATALRDVIAEIQSEPIVGASESLDVDRAAGIALQRVPAHRGPHKLVDDVRLIHDLHAVRQKLPSLVATVLGLLPAGTGGVAEGESQSHVVIALAERLIEANLTLNKYETELARDEARLAVPAVKVAIKKGEMIIRDGERFAQRHLLILRALAKSGRQTSLLLVALGAAALLSIIVMVSFMFTRARGRILRLNARDTLFLSLLLLGWLCVARVWLFIAFALHVRFSLPMSVFVFALPVAAGPMIARLVLRVEAALVFAVVSSLAVALLAVDERGFAMYALVGAVLGATTVGNMSARSDLLRAGVWIGTLQAVMAAGSLLFEANAVWFHYALVVPVAFVSGVLAAFGVLALTPVVEAVFDYTTDLKLLELANLNHPALKELIVQAPGSYHHSIIVGSLVEAAAEAIGANALLARVMAYYHDLGKGCNPVYFIENQRSGQNPHDKLKPSMSAIVIRRHITDGLELARRYRLGEQIIAGILEHHGTTLIHYFYHRAKEQADESNPVSESDYRYAGRKPQSRESALVMLADSIEAAARSLAEPTSARLQGLVTRVINIKFGDGQLEECDLTLRDLHTIAKAFSRVLVSIYHQRVEYPELLKDLMGTSKKHPNGDLDSKQPKKPENHDGPPDESRPDNLRRLGLS